MFRPRTLRPFCYTLRSKIHPSLCRSPIYPGLLRDLKDVGVPQRAYTTDIASKYGNSPYRRMPSEYQQFKQDLERKSFDKWGFVIYRCTYSDDKAWRDCMNILKGRVHYILAKSDAPELMDSLEWTIFDDDALDHAFKGDLRRRFRDWNRSAWAREQPRAERTPHGANNARYRYFVSIDCEAMESVLENPNVTDVGPFYTGYVNLVDAEWKDQAELLAELTPNWREMYNEEVDTSFEPIEGCKEEDVGWFKLPASSMIPGAYFQLDPNPGMWQYMYHRPPTISY